MLTLNPVICKESDDEEAIVAASSLRVGAGGCASDGKAVTCRFVVAQLPSNKKSCLKI
jgi:hypothetical protein